MTHSLAQELTMVTELTDIEAAQDYVNDLIEQVMMQDRDPVEILESEGLEARQCWINELTAED